MTSRKAGTLLIALVPLVGLVVTCALGAQDDAPHPEKELNTLLKERRETLAQRLEFLEQKQALGIVGLRIVASARIDVLDADLELASTKAARIEVHKKRVQEYRRLEEFAAAFANAPQRPSAPGQPSTNAPAAEDALLARAARMQAEIDMLREELTPE